MRIEFVEIANFRKLFSARIGLSKEKTVFVGANNSGKTSAITAVRYFLVDRERPNFCFNDFTLSHWPIINAMGRAWEAAHIAQKELPESEWGAVLPFLDVWLNVADNEVHQKTFRANKYKLCFPCLTVPKSLESWAEQTQMSSR